MNFKLTERHTGERFNKELPRKLCRTPARSALILAALLLIGCSDKQALHAKGHCGSMSPGTGLTDYPDDKRGWVASMIRGTHHFRINGNGNVYLTFARTQSADFTSDLPMHTIRLEGTDHASILEWKIPGAKNWEPVPITFLYPRARSAAQDAIDRAIKEGTRIPGTRLTAEQMMDPARVVQPENHPFNRFRSRPNSNDL
jgi:hypothetical protein